jgi:hypothetical protein
MAYVMSLLSPTAMKEILGAFIDSGQAPSAHLMKSLADVCGITEETLRQHLTDCHDSRLRGDSDLFAAHAESEVAATETTAS